MTWKDVLGFFLQKSIITNVVVSLIFIIILLTVRGILSKTLGRRSFGSDEIRLRWHVRLRNTILVLMLLGLMSIWATQLHTFALSAVAFVAAMVLATKELIMCISGGFLRMVSNNFTLGDRIEVGAFRGEVVNIGFLTTTLLEVGPGHQRTGRAQVLPNSIFVNTTVINETFTDNYVLHIVQIPIPRNESWEQAESILLDSAQEVCAPYLEAAQEHLDRAAKKHALTSSNAEPKVLVQVQGLKEITLIVRFPTPAREKGRHEQELVRNFLKKYQSSIQVPLDAEVED